MRDCKKCGCEIPPERVEALDTNFCINCTDGFQPSVTGFMVYGSKTAGEIAIVSNSNPEALRQAINADKRKR